jgi:hypothetical protein
MSTLHFEAVEKLHQASKHPGGTENLIINIQFTRSSIRLYIPQHQRTSRTTRCCSRLHSRFQEVSEDVCDTGVAEILGPVDDALSPQSLRLPHGWWLSIVHKP